MTIKDIIESARLNKAILIIGNGINRHNQTTQNVSWDQILINLFNAKNENNRIKKSMQGLSQTELFDTLGFRSREFNRETINQQISDFIRHIEDWKPQKHHISIVNWAKKNQIPVLTTNFDETLLTDERLKWGRCGTNDGYFSTHYPWNFRYALPKEGDSADDFGIWHINGLLRYKNSLRLGLCDYMGSVQKARTMLHKSKNGLFAKQGRENWVGKNTWLHLFFHRNLIFIGLGLGESEIFLRWLLIQRKRYHRLRSLDLCDSWYVQTKKENSENPGKAYFLKNTGVEIVTIESHEEVYSDSLWTI